MYSDRYVARAMELIRKRIAADTNWNVLSVVPEEDWFRTVSVALQLFPTFLGSRQLTTVEILLVEDQQPKWESLLARSGGAQGRSLATLGSDPRAVWRIELTNELELSVLRQGDLFDVYGPEYPSEQPDTKLSSDAGLTWRWVDDHGSTAVFVYWSPVTMGYGVDTLHPEVSYPPNEFYQHFASVEDAFAFVNRLRGIRVLPRKSDWMPR